MTVRQWSGKVKWRCWLLFLVVYHWYKVVIRYDIQLWRHLWMVYQQNINEMRTLAPIVCVQYCYRHVWVAEMCGECSFFFLVVSSEVLCAVIWDVLLCSMVHRCQLPQSWRWLQCWNKLCMCIVHLTLVCHIYCNLIIVFTTRKKKFIWHFRFQVFFLQVITVINKCI